MQPQEDHFPYMEVQKGSFPLGFIAEQYFRQSRPAFHSRIICHQNSAHSFSPLVHESCFRLSISQLLELQGPTCFSISASSRCSPSESRRSPPYPPSSVSLSSFSTYHPHHCNHNQPQKLLRPPFQPLFSPSQDRSHLINHFGMRQPFPDPLQRSHNIGRKYPAGNHDRQSLPYQPVFL